MWAAIFRGQPRWYVTVSLAAFRQMRAASFDEDFLGSHERQLALLANSRARVRARVQGSASLVPV